VEENGPQNYTIFSRKVLGFTEQERNPPARSDEEPERFRFSLHFPNMPIYKMLMEEARWGAGSQRVNG
jgi:hypothetical protein